MRMSRKNARLMLAMWREALAAAGYRRGQNADRFRGYDSALVRTAIHESGHVVVGQYLGGAPLAATLGGWRAGETLCASVFGICIPGATVEALRQKMTHLAAGTVAVSIFDPTAKNERGSDQEDLESEAWRIVGRRSPWKDVDCEIEAAHVRAEKLLRANWKHVEAVALALLRFHETIDRISLARQDAFLDSCEGQLS